MPKRNRIWSEIEEWLSEHRDSELKDNLEYVLEYVPKNHDQETMAQQELYPIFQKILDGKVLTPEEVQMEQYTQSYEFMLELKKEGAPLWFYNLLLNDKTLRTFFQQLYGHAADYLSDQYKKKPILWKTNEEKFMFSESLLNNADMIYNAIQHDEERQLLFQFTQWQARFSLSKYFTLSMPVISFPQQQKLQCGMPDQTADQKLAVKLQTSAKRGESYKINQWIRTGSPESLVSENKLYSIPEIVAKLDTLLCSPTLPRLDEPIFVQRGVDQTVSLNDKGQKSTSLDPTLAMAFCKTICIIFQIELPAGFPIQKICTEETEHGEMEVLLSRGTYFVPIGGSFDIYFKKTKFRVIRVRAMQQCV